MKTIAVTWHDAEKEQPTDRNRRLVMVRDGTREGSVRIAWWNKCITMGASGQWNVDGYGNESPYGIAFWAEEPLPEPPAGFQAFIEKRKGERRQE